MTRSTFFGSLELYNIGISVGGADWYDRGEYIIAATGNIGMLDFYEVHADTGQTSWLGSNSDVHALWYELAYDKDVNVLWYLDQRTLFGLDPESFDTVARLRPAGIGFEGGAGSIDNVPDQTPEILVTGECPGTLYVTVVDATPGGQVLVASGTRRGQRVLRSGACAGAVTDLANPTPRFDLVARPTGIATTTIRATAPMCNTVAFQAIDVATCKVTSARVAQTMLLAP